MERNRQNNLWFKKKTRFCLERQANAFAVFCSSSPSGKSIFLCMFCLFTTYEEKSKIYWLNVLRIIHYSQHPHQVRILSIYEIVRLCMSVWSFYGKVSNRQKNPFWLVFHSFKLWWMAFVCFACCHTSVSVCNKNYSNNNIRNQAFWTSLWETLTWELQ